MREGATIALEAGTIRSVSDAAPPPGAVVLDLAGRVVTPGLIDTHVHLLAGAADAPTSGAELTEQLETRVPERLLALLSAGVTTILSNGDYWPAIAGLARRVAAGELAGPQLRWVGPFVSVPGGHPGATMCRVRGRVNPWCLEHLVFEVDSQHPPPLARLSGAHGVKLVFDDLGAARIRKMPLPVAATIVAAVRDLGLAPLAHVYDPDDALALIDLGIRRLVHVPGGADRRANRRLLKAMRGSGTMASSTLAMLDYAVERTGALTTRRRLIGARQLAPELAAAGLLAFGTDAAWLDPASAVRREIGLLAHAGVSPKEVFFAATRDAARYLGMEEKLGTVAPGMQADLLVLRGNPLSDIQAWRDPLLVIKAGRIVVDRRGPESGP